MCGLFGVMVPLSYPREQRRALGARVRMLGYAAQERGIDAAGLAMLTDLDQPVPPRQSLGGAARVQFAGWNVMRTTGAFRRLRSTVIDETARGAHLILGHTRWATQGALLRAHASPMLVGRVLGTHNGDIDVASLAPYSARPRAAGTDSAVLFDALSDAHECGSITHDVVPVLTHAVGRIAAVWADVHQPGSVWLARGALSPLALGLDAYGAVWWASNPLWLRELSREHHLGIARVRLLREGALLGLTLTGRDITPTAAHVFTAHARRSDERIATVAAWRGFPDRDRCHDQRHLRHVTVDAAPGHPDALDAPALWDGALV